MAGSPQRAHAYTDLGVPLVWQVASRFSFRVANAYVGSFPPVLPLAIRRFEFGQPLSAAQRSAVVAWIGRTGVSAVVVVSPIGRELAPIRALLGTTSIRLPGAAVLPVSGVPSCSPTLGAPG